MAPTRDTAELTADAEQQDLEERARPFRALYEHWERNQWSPLDIDYTEDRASFEALDESERQGFTWIFSHRFHAEFKVATILAPFVMRAPTYETQVVLATQLSDEFRHMNSVLRVHDEVFGISDMEEIRAMADRNMDPVASALYDAFELRVRPLETSDDPDVFLKAVVAYHLIAEGTVARTVPRTSRRVSTPGTARSPASRPVSASSPATRRATSASASRSSAGGWRRDRDHTMAVIGEIIEDFTEMAGDLLETALSGGMDSQVLAGYGVEAEGFYAEAMRLWQLRLRSIGYLEE